MAAAVTVADGLARRHDGQAAVEAADTAPHRRHGRYVAAAITELAAVHGTFTADSIRERAAALADAAGDTFAPHSPNLLPSHIGNAVKAGQIVPVGSYQSPQPTRHASRNKTYRGAGRCIIEPVDPPFPAGPQPRPEPVTVDHPPTTTADVLAALAGGPIVFTRRGFRVCLRFTGDEITAEIIGRWSEPVATLNLAPEQVAIHRNTLPPLAAYAAEQTTQKGPTP